MKNSVSVLGKLGMVASILGLFLLSSTGVLAAETESAVRARRATLRQVVQREQGRKPTADHAAYPHKGGKYGKDVSWRCKECHGWDYKGKDGSYASGAHATGIKGISGAAGKDPARCRGDSQGQNHAYTTRC